ncbi:hypothetical protein ACMFMF_011928 [Clarireedia jacksonii]
MPNPSKMTPQPPNITIQALLPVTIHRSNNTVFVNNIRYIAVSAVDSYTLLTQTTMKECSVEKTILQAYPVLILCLVAIAFLVVGWGSAHQHYFRRPSWESRHTSERYWAMQAEVYEGLD